MDTKFCKKCQTEKSLSEFYLSVPSRCKVCRNSHSTLWRKTHPKEWNNIVRKSERKIPQSKKREWAKKFHERNPDWAKQYYQDNSHIWIHCSRVRQQKIKDQTPPWADMKKIKLIYQEAKLLSLEVDHIIPLRGEIVCGLHVEHNLQLLTKEENRKKSNNYANYDPE